MKTLSVLCVVCTLAVLSVSATAEPKLKNCNEVREAFTSKGFNMNDAPNKVVNGEFYSSALLFKPSGSSSEAGRGAALRGVHCKDFPVLLFYVFKLVKLAVITPVNWLETFSHCCSRFLFLSNKNMLNMSFLFFYYIYIYIKKTRFKFLQILKTTATPLLLR